MLGRAVKYFFGGGGLTVKSTEMWCGGAAGSRRGCTLLLLLLLCAALAHAFLDKRAEMSSVPFVMGSRYGRSPARPLSPRNDRFFLGSRYGKRAVMTSPHAPPDEPLECEYTGVYPLYRCVRAPPPLPSLSRRPLPINRYQDDSTETDRGDPE